MGCGGWGLIFLNSSKAFEDDFAGSGIFACQSAVSGFVDTSFPNGGIGIFTVSFFAEGV